MQYMNDSEEILKNYEGWLRRQAYIISPSGDSVEDLIQEGRIAMWKALDKYDPSRGPLSSYLVTVAYFKMGSCLKNHRWTGSSRSSTQFGSKVPPAPTKDISELADTTDQIPESADLSYHLREIHESVAALPEKQRTYIDNRFWKEVRHRDNLSHGLWDGTNRYKGARKNLREKLSHLEGVV